MRRRLIAIPYSAARYGIRLDYSPKFREFVFYYWSPKRGIRTLRRRTKFVHIGNGEYVLTKARGIERQVHT